MGVEIKLDLDGEIVPVKVRRNAQARRMILRVCPNSGEIRLTLPKRASTRAANRFLDDHLDWINIEREKAGPCHPIGSGDAVPFQGIDRELIFTGVPPRTVRAHDDRIEIGGPAEHANKRLLNWFKKQARGQLIGCADQHARRLGVAFGRVSIGDMRSRWGSCSSKKTLRFNWRLVLAPPEILSYVAAHEVAHLVEMNHSPAFWAQVEACDPGYKAHRAWLKQEGQRLFSVII